MRGETKTDAISSGTPEQLTPPREFDRVFGCQERRFEVTHVDKLLMLPQIRDNMFDQAEELEASIESNDLLYVPSIAVVNDEELTEYLDFVNCTWGSEIGVADLEDYRMPTGLFNLVVAGHRRGVAIQRIADKEEARTGIRPYVGVNGEVLDDNSVDNILAVQYRENLHSKVKDEREAMAVVELYRWGIKKDWWQSPDEFIESPRSGKLDRRILNDAISFASLPPEICRLVFSRHIKYNAGIALGRAMDTIRDYYASEVGLTKDDDLGADIEKAIEYRLKADAVHIYNVKMNSTAAARYVKGFVDYMQSEVAIRRGVVNDAKPKEESLFGMISAAEEGRRILKEQELSLARCLKEVASHPMQEATALLLRIAGKEDSETIMTVLDDALTAHGELAAHLGKRATRTLIHEVESLEPSDDQALLADVEIKV